MYINNVRLGVRAVAVHRLFKLTLSATQTRMDKVRKWSQTAGDPVEEAAGALSEVQVDARDASARGDLRPSCTQMREHGRACDNRAPC